MTTESGVKLMYSIILILILVITFSLFFHYTKNEEQKNLAGSSGFSVQDDSCVKINEVLIYTKTWKQGKLTLPQIEGAVEQWQNGC